jgi:hypothetical protein
MSRWILKNSIWGPWKAARKKRLDYFDTVPEEAGRHTVPMETVLSFF